MSMIALTIANEISQRVIHMPAQADGNHPILSEIYAEMSSSQRRLAGMENWTWLKSTVDVDGFEATSTEASITAGIILYESTGHRTSALANKTEYYAQRITTSTYLAKLISVSINLKLGQTGAGAPSGVMSLYVCPDSGGSPDLDNPVMTADTLALPSLSTSWSALTFLFTATTTVLFKRTNYWIVFKWVGADDNGDSMFVADDPTMDAVATTFKTRLNNASVWTVQTGYLLTTTLTYYQSDYIDTILMPATVVDVSEMHTGDETDRPVSLLPYSNDRFINSGADLPVDTFCIRKVSGNRITVYHNSRTPSILYHCECQLFPTTITADGDYMLCPDAGIDYIIYESAAILGADILDDRKIAEYHAIAAAVKVDMEFKYVSRPQGRRIVRPGTRQGSSEYTKNWNRRRYGR